MKQLLLFFALFCCITHLCLAETPAPLVVGDRTVRCFGQNCGFRELQYGPWRLDEDSPPTPISYRTVVCLGPVSMSIPGRAAFVCPLSIIVILLFLVVPLVWLARRRTCPHEIDEAI